jgi:hypothetical protein
VIHRSYKVRKVITEESSSTRRRDSMFTTHEYQLTYGGLSVMDEYLASIMPYKVDYNSEYNDSTPGSSGSYMQVEYSDYGLGVFKLNYDVNDHLAFISKSHNLGEGFLPKCEVQEAYHEFGHLTGFVLSSQYGYQIGSILNLDLTSQSPHLSIHKPLYSLPNYYDKHRVREYVDEIIYNLNENRTRTLLYFVYIMMGGVFNVVYKIQEPERWDIDKVFEDYGNSIKYSSIDGRAADDFNKLKRYETDLKWSAFSFENFKDMAYDLVIAVKKCNLINFKLHSGRCSYQYLIEKSIGRKITDKKEISEICSRINNLIESTGFRRQFNPILKKYSDLIDGTISINNFDLYK